MSHPMLEDKQEFAERDQHWGTCVICKRNHVWCDAIWLDGEHYSVCLECIAVDDWSDMLDRLKSAVMAMAKEKGE